MTRIPGTIWRPGPSWKRGYSGVTQRTLDGIEGEVKHDAAGGLASLFWELDRPDRTASWTFSHDTNGDTYQHYELEDITWHAGLPGDRRFDTSLIGNITLVGEEHVRDYPGQLIAGAQEEASAKLSRAIRDLCPHVKARPPQLRVNLWEHGWLAPTACPSGRVIWASMIGRISVLAEGDDMLIIIAKQTDPNTLWVLYPGLGRAYMQYPELKAQAGGGNVLIGSSLEPVPAVKRILPDAEFDGIEALPENMLAWMVATDKTLAALAAAVKAIPVAPTNVSVVMTAAQAVQLAAALKPVIEQAVEDIIEKTSLQVKD